MIPHKRVTELIDITQEELDKIEFNMEVGECKTIYVSKELSIDLLKERPNKVRKIISTYGTIPFHILFKEMLKIAYPNGLEYKDK
ncbi:hypothetical protein LL033_17300 [Clostridium estertheticum]|uniref:hypothetical protein n=1 Tax=Clostridium estertheticum TaxID=238834 RepID=UPI001C0D7C4A|nr:hypothetical protein [Clostridium estertheticum]MBU3216674.1 hypothetical protein [Clostridium estertheticum]WAG54370.1 hypothetical protein LL033_17300 [Clostridium estertheticum]